MKKLLTIVLSLVLILDVAPVFAYAAGSSNPADDVKAASEKLAEVKAKLEQAQKAYDEYIKEDPQIEEKYTKAQSAASEAEEALRKAETELASAHAAYDSAESIYQEKVSAQEIAKSEYESALQTKEDKTEAKEKAAAALAEAQEAYDSYVDSISDDPDIRNASNELKAAKEAVEVAEAKVQEKTEALAAANAEAADAKAAKDAADNKVINARAAEKPYEDAVNKAMVAVDAAQTEKEAADTAVDNAQAEYDNVSQAVTDKEAEIKETEQRISAAENNLAAAESAKVKAQADIAAAESAKTKAQADKKEAEAAIAEYQTSAEEKLNAKDFFVWLSENEDQSAAVRESAAVAARMLSNQVTSADLSKIQNDGTVSSSSSSKTYAEIIGNTHIGQEGDATYWDNFKYAITLAGKGNEYRAKESLYALKISSVMMAMGEINANYQRSISGISHSSAFLALENLAYNTGGQGTSAGYPDPVFKEYDPFDGWYTREKKVYDYLVEKGWNVDVSKLTSDQKNTVKTELGLSKLSDVQTGHYMTLTDRNGGTKMISSGFGYVNQVSKYMDGGFYWTDSTEKYSHMFGYSRSYASGQDGITVDAYSNLVTAYEESIGELPAELEEALNAAVEALAKAEEDLTNANNAYTTANTNVTNSNAELTAANAELETRQTELDALKSEKTVKQNILQSAKSVQSDKAAALETANAALTTARNELAAKQQETSAAEAAASDAAAAYDDKQTALIAAQNAKTSAEEELQTAKNTRDERQQALDSILEEKIGSSDVAVALREAQKNDDNAEAELAEAENEVAAKESALTAANKEIESATNEKNIAQQLLTEKTDAKDLADSGKTEADNTLTAFEKFVNAKAALESAKAEAASAQATYDEAKTAYDKAKAAEEKAAAEEARKTEEVHNIITAKPEKVDLKAVKGLKITAARGRIVVKWKKATKKELKTFQGYEIQYTRNGTFKDYPAKKVSKKKASVTLKKLLRKKKYKVRIRRYRDDGSVLHVSAWKTKKAKTK